MGARTKIEWTDATFNPWIGCTKVTRGCDHCYAEGIAQRLGVGWGPHAERRLSNLAYWEQPYRWARQARQKGIRPRVFCASMADVFDNQVPVEWRARLWQLIRGTPELDWLILTKRPENIWAMLPDGWYTGWTNVWLGISAEDQATFDHRWPILRKTSAFIRFVSYEPALGPLDIMGRGSYGIDWLICGGESGRHHRPMNPIWEGSIREQCRIVGVAYFFKQFAGKKPIPAEFPLVRQFPLRQQEDVEQFEMF